MEQQQGTIRYNVAINSLYKSDKGKELLAYNLENSSLVGIAITPNMVNDLNSKFTFINLMKKRLNEENKEKKGWEPLPLINFSTNLKDYSYDPIEKIYKRKLTDEKKPIPNTTVIIEEMIDKDKKFNYNPRR